jgi:hypothetical protein
MPTSPSWLFGQSPGELYLGHTKIDKSFRYLAVWPVRRVELLHFISDRSRPALSLLGNYSLLATPSWSTGIGGRITRSSLP